jgi:hypothetical protein
MGDQLRFESTESHRGYRIKRKLKVARPVLKQFIGTAWTQDGVTLPRGWAETLLRSGKLRVGTLALDTSAAAWTNTHLSKFSCNEIHNSHVHIGLDDTKLIR